MNLIYEMTAPLSHIGETASTGAYFQTVLTAYGRVPVVTGNSIRGQLRNIMAMRLLDTVSNTVIGGYKAPKEVFHILFSGGNINSSMRDDLGKARDVRSHFPAVSLMGAALGDMILEGRLRVGFAYPICHETTPITGIESAVSWHNSIDEIEFTRMDDMKNDALAQYCADPDTESKGTASQQMRYSVQYLSPGTQLWQTIDFLTGVTDLEKGAFFDALFWWADHDPVLGGMSAKGFGRFNLQSDLDTPENRKLADSYIDFIASEGTEYFTLLESKGGKKNGKKAN